MGAQRTTTRSRQRGLSFIGVIFVGLIAVAAFAIGGQSVPIFLEYFAIKKAAAKAARDGSTVPEIRAAFDRAMTGYHGGGTTTAELAASRARAVCSTLTMMPITRVIAGTQTHICHG